MTKTITQKYFFEQETKGEVEIKDIYLYEALNITQKNTKKYQDINVFTKDKSGNYCENFSLKKEMDLHNSMSDILSYYPRWYNRKKFNRQSIITSLRGRQAAKQLAQRKKEDLQKQKFIAEQKSNSITQVIALISVYLTIGGIVFAGFPGFPESSIVSKLSNSSVNYKTCAIIKKDKDTKQKDLLCNLNKTGYEIAFLLILSANLLMSLAKFHCTNDLLIINHALDISSGEPPGTDEPQH